MSPLLLLFRPRAAGPVLSAGANLAALSLAVLLQRPRLAGERTAPRRNCLPDGGQRVCGDRRLEPSPNVRRRILPPSIARRSGRAGAPVCAVSQTVPQRLPLESHAGGI